jgi:hypothetical protein
MHLALPWYLRVSTELLSCFIGAKVQAESYTSSFFEGRQIAALMG